MRCIYDGLHPCGRCPACLANRQRAFCFRLDQEKENCSFYYWLTLQYDDDHVPRLENGEMCFSKEHCRIFFEKIRKRYQEKRGKKEKNFTFKHFLVCEYGPNATHRPHYHLLLLVYSSLSLAECYTARREMREFILNEAWSYGHVTEKSFHGRVLSYLTKYCTKPELNNEFHTMKPFTLISRGIGLCFLDSLTEEHKEQMRRNLDFTIRYGNGKLQLPRYYTDRILPHSMEDLRKTIPSDPLGDWSEYDKMLDLRSRMFARNNRKVSLRAQSMINVPFYEEIKSRDMHIKGTLQNFRSKIKLRKDL